MLQIETLPVITINENAFMIYIINYQLKLYQMSQKVQWNQLTPLSENNPAYEPEIQQILGYAQFIGLQLPQDNRYLYLARQGLKSSLPPFWQACEAQDGELYFRNKKTRVITTDNPLDQVYIQKVKELKQLEAQTNIFSINQESALNQSSGMYRSRSKPNQIRKSQRNGINLSQINPILQRNITEESIQFQNPSAQKYFNPQKSDLPDLIQPQWKVKQRLQILQLRARIERMVPQKHQLITTIQTISDYSKVERIMNTKNLQKLINLRLKVEEKRAKLQQYKRQRKQLQQIADKIADKT